MSKRQSEQPSSSKYPRVEDDDLSDYDIEFDHIKTLSIKQSEFADQFLSKDVEQTLPEDYVEPHVMLNWGLERIAQEERDESIQAEKDQDDEEREEYEILQEIEDEEEEAEEEEAEDEAQEITEEIANSDGELSQSTQEILEIVYGEHTIDPYSEFSIKPNSRFPDWLNALIKARHGEIPLIKEEFYKGYECEKHTAFGDKWPGFKKYTIIIDNGSTKKRSFEQNSMLIKHITIDQIYQFFNQLIGLVDYIVCRCDKTERECVEYQHYHCILISSKEYQPQRFRSAFNKSFGCEDEFIKKNVRKFFIVKWLLQVFLGICHRGVE